VAVELDEGRHNRVDTGSTLNERVRVTRVEDSRVPEIRVVERLLAVVLVDGGGVATNKVITLNDPGEELDGVVEVHADLVSRGSDRLLARELELLNEILVRLLSHLAALIRVEVDVIYEERAGLETLVLYIRVDVGVAGPAHVLDAGKVNEHLDLVVLEGNQRQSETRVAAVEELEGDVHRVSGGALAYSRRRYRLRVTISRAYIVAVLTSRREEVDKLGDVADHACVTTLLARGERELVPDVHPVAILLIDLLTTNLELYLRD